MNNYALEIDRIKKFNKSLENKILQDKTKKEMLLEKKASLAKEAERLDDKNMIFEKTKLLLEKTSDYARKEAIKSIENMVTCALHEIFASQSKFVIEEKSINGKVAVDFFLEDEVDGEKIMTDPQEQRGGGYVDIISLALRFAMIEVFNPKIEGPILLDEPAKFVSEDYIYNVAEFLSKVSESFNRQIIMVTHSKYLSNIGDKTFEVIKRDNVSEVVEK